MAGRVDIDARDTLVRITSRFLGQQAMTRRFTRRLGPTRFPSPSRAQRMRPMPCVADAMYPLQ